MVMQILQSCRPPFVDQASGAHAPALADLIKQGRVRAGSRVDLVRSNIGMAVKAGAPKPDISTVAALKRTLLWVASLDPKD